MDGVVPAKSISEVEDERNARSFNRWMVSQCVRPVGQHWPLSSAMYLLIAVLLLVSPLTAANATTTKTSATATGATPNVTAGHKNTTTLHPDITTSNTTPPSNATGFFYWMVLHVEVIDAERNESLVTKWLENAFHTYLHNCKTPDGQSVTSTTPPPSNHTSNMSSNPAYDDNSQSATTTDLSTTVTTMMSKAGKSEVTSSNFQVITSPTEKPITLPLDWNGTDPSVFQEIDVCCTQKERINQTVCSVVVKLSSPRTPCCFRYALRNASRTSKGPIYSSIQNNKVILLERPNSTSNSLNNCSSGGEEETAQNASNCFEEFGQLFQTCNCSQNCGNGAAYAYYAMSLNITNSSITSANITSMVNKLNNTSSCNSNMNDCEALKEVSKIYQKGYSVCPDNKTSELKCVVILKLSQICSQSKVQDALNSVFNQTGIKTSPARRVALCGDSFEHPKEVQWEELKVNKTYLNLKQFCTFGPAFLNILNCQPGKILLVELRESCGGSGSGSGSESPSPTITPLTTLSTRITPETSPRTNSTTRSPTATTPSGGLGTGTTSTVRTSATPVTSSTTRTSSRPALSTTTTTTATTEAPLATTTSSAEDSANNLLDLTRDVSSLNSSQVEQLVSQLEALLAGPNVSLALGRTSINIVSNLLGASPDVVASSATRLIRIVDTVGLKLVLTGPSESILFDSLALAVRRVDGTNFKETTISLTDPNTLQISDPRQERSAAGVEGRVRIPQGSITLPSTLTQNLSFHQQQAASRLQFNFYQRSTLFQDHTLSGNRSLVSGILSTSVANLSISNLRDNIIITLRNNRSITENQENYTRCVFWDFTLYNDSGGWNTNGCTVLNVTAEQTICGCSHLTSFGILLDISGIGPPNLFQARILSYITYIGCGISAIFLSITLLTYLAFGKLRKDIPSKILIQLCFALLLLNLVFLLDAWLALYPDAEGLCISTAWFLHYFLLCAFTWMGLEAVHMYIALVKVFNSYVSRFMLKFSLIGWGVPLVVVIIVIAIDKDNYGLVSYGSYGDAPRDEFCWLKNRVAFYVAVVAYYCVIFLMNMAMFVVVLVQLGRIKRQNPHNVQHRSRLQDARSIAGLTMLLGLTWGFAFFAWGPVNLAFMYLFAIFNSFQGFFIFVFHCAVKENVRRQWRTYLCCGKLRLAENSDWSRTATQNKNRITSMMSSRSQNSNTSSSYLGMDLSIRNRSTRSPTEDRMISDTDSNSDVVHNDINNQHHHIPARPQVSWVYHPQAPRCHRSKVVLGGCLSVHLTGRPHS
ncbi:hypothetical protein ACEWY4_010001 [Coilia grayii]|uniref:Adhesion G-protein coupled receptor G2 n=1 Tax=Coilia grayii TaxID=363190 RepID=A0ABD1K851_9TELE